MTDARPTPLDSVHRRLGARMTPFAGFSMPLQYDGILKEHHRVRQAVGLFDVSHMGEVRITGPDAVDAVNRLISNDLNRVKDGRAQYTTMCHPDGTIVDDLICYRVSSQEVFICINAANRDIDPAHMREHLSGDVTLTDESDDWAQIAVQGALAKTLMGRVFGEKIGGLRPFRIRSVDFSGRSLYVATTGYTGEPGCEIYCRPDDAVAVWERLEAEGEDLNVGPAGLGARDTLRLEMAYCLYGSDIDRTTTPLEAGLDWVTRLDTEFVGRDALVAQRDGGVSRKLVGVEVFDRGIPRKGYPIVDVNGAEIGRITSGTKSPSTGRAIGLGYVSEAFATEGTELRVDCRGRHKSARVVTTPFYSKE